MRWIEGGQRWTTAPYLEALRERIVRVADAGTFRTAAAKQFEVSISFIVKLMQPWCQRGTIKAVTSTASTIQSDATPRSAINCRSHSRPSWLKQSEHLSTKSGQDQSLVVSGH
jgi:transposase